MVASVTPKDKETCKRTPQEIHHALQVLKDVCESQDVGDESRYTCAGCSLYDCTADTCMVCHEGTNPTEWVLADPIETIWRAFK